MKRLRFLMKKMWMLIIMFSMFFVSCDFFSDGDSKSDDRVTISAIKLTSSDVKVQVGSITYIGYTVVPSGTEIEPEWNYDSSIIEIEKQSNGAVIKGLKEGETSLTVTYQKRSATAIVKVQGFADTYVDTTDPYIYSNTQILNMQPGDAEMISVSLYNGTAADIDGYTWSIDNPATATLQQTGQYCKIQAKNTGYARIKVTHTKSSDPYYIGIYVFDDLSKATYLSTKYNLSTLRVSEGEKTVSVTLENPKTTEYTSGFLWKITEGSEYLSITPNGPECVFTPLKTGIATVRVEHSQAAYPIELKARVIETVENVYIEPSDTKVILSGNSENTKIISAELSGIKQGSYSIDDFSYEIIQDNETVSWYSWGNQISVTGLHNGAAQLYIKHPCSQKKRQVLIICENQIADAVDASCMLTTTQNYIKTKVGAEETSLQVILQGGTEEDNRNFKWKVVQQPEDGTSDVIELMTADGTVENSRMAASTLTYGTAYIKPLAVGTAAITVTNSKSFYPLEILVKVLDASAVLEEQYYFTGDGIVKFLNSETYSYSVSLKKAPEAQKNGITWESDSPNLNIVASGEDAQLSSTATGSNISHMTINHVNAASPKEVCVLTADTQEELDSMKAFYSNKMYYSVNAESTVNIYVDQVGFTGEDGETLDFSTVASQVIWTSSDPTIASVERCDNPLVGTVTGLKAGTAKITIKYGDVSAVFTVTVYPKGVAISEVETTAYLSTKNNVIIIPEAGGMATASVTPIGIASSKYSGISWSIDDQSIATVVGNGTSATITAVGEGEAVITVSHEDSENTLKIYVRVGSEYVVQSPVPVTYIYSSTDVIAILKDAPNYNLSACLVNPENESDGLSGFSFTLDGTDVVEMIAQYGTGSCWIKPVQAGQAEITISHPKAKYPKKVLVVIANTLEELSAYKYLSTNQNVVNIGEGNTKTVTVTMENATEIYLDGYNWQSENPNVASVVSTSGSTAVIKGNSIGTTRILVTHSACTSNTPLEIIIQVVDPVLAAACPFITVNPPIINLIENGGWSSVNVELEGGSEDDVKDFVWTSSDTSVIDLYGQNNTARVRAKKAGTALIKIMHPKSIYPAQIRCICDAAASAEYSISVSTGNILSIKPDGGDTTITASLINGGTSDKYNFNWSLDVYDVVDLTYSANTAVITPLKEGTATLTVSHPKSAFDQQIKIKVQQYETFSFASDSKKIKEGKSVFIAMQIPASSVETVVAYESKNQKVCKIEGTKAVCELIGTGAGTTTVNAYLKNAKTLEVLSTAEMLVSVEEAATELVYITGNGGVSSTFSMTKGTNKILSAEIVGEGIVITDQANLAWKSSNPNIVKINGTDAGGNICGASVYVEALDSGECTITVSHEKANSDMVYHIIVPGVEEATVSLDKNFVTVEKGKTTDIKATIEGGTKSDYQNLVWSIDKVNGTEIATCMGSGQQVTVYAYKAGITTLKCTNSSNGSYDTCQIKVEDPKSFTIDRDVIRLPPGDKNARSFTYKVSPADATIEWVYNSSSVDASSIFSFSDTGPGSDGKGTVTVFGIKEGTSRLSGVSSYGNKANIQIQVAWDYQFSLDMSRMDCKPTESQTFTYTVVPQSAVITFENETELKDLISCKIINPDSTGKGTIIITPKKEVTGKTAVFKATNPAFDSTTCSPGSTLGDKIGEQSIALNITYPNLNVKLLSVKGDGKFSRMDGQSVVVGDGETTTLAFGFAEDKAEGKITSISLELTSEAKNKYGHSNNIDLSQAGSSTIYTMRTVTDDKIEEVYKITKLYIPYLDNAMIKDWDSTDNNPFAWKEYWKDMSSGSDEYFSLVYTPKGGGVNKLMNTTQAGQRKANVYFWAEDHDIDGYGDYRNYYFNCTATPNHSNVYDQPLFNTWAGWSKRQDTNVSSSRPKYMTRKEFEENAWLFCAGTTDEDDDMWVYWDSENQRQTNKEHTASNWKHGTMCHSSGGVHVCPHVMDQNVTAIKGTASEKSSNMVSEFIGNLKVNFNHLGNPESNTIPVYLEIRTCEKNLSNSVD